MISAQTLRVCREGKPVPTLADHATSRPRLHPGLTKPRQYDGKVGAAAGAPFLLAALSKQVARMSAAICGIGIRSRMSRSLLPGAHSRDPLAHPGYAPVGNSLFSRLQFARRKLSPDRLQPRLDRGAARFQQVARMSAAICGIGIKAPDVALLIRATLAEPSAISLSTLSIVIT